MKLTVLSPVEHDGRAYAEGETVDVKDEAQAQVLIACGVAEAIPAKKPKAAEAEA